MAWDFPDPYEDMTFEEAEEYLGHVKKQCSNCGGRGAVPATGRGSDGFEKCPDCDGDQ